jgi:hypothetical protein
VSAPDKAFLLGKAPRSGQRWWKRSATREVSTYSGAGVNASVAERWKWRRVKLPELKKVVV